MADDDDRDDGRLELDLLDDDDRENLLEDVGALMRRKNLKGDPQEFLKFLGGKPKSEPTPAPTPTPTPSPAPAPPAPETAPAAEQKPANNARLSGSWAERHGDLGSERQWVSASSLDSDGNIPGRI